MTTPTVESERHRLLHEIVSRHLGHYRAKFLIPPRWNIEVLIMCADEHTTNDAGAQASMSWEVLCNAQYRLRVWCDIEDEDVEWAVMHELLEAITAPYADLCCGLILETKGSTGRKLAKQERHREIRDEIVEWMLDILAPEKRPGVGKGI